MKKNQEKPKPQYNNLIIILLITLIILFLFLIWIFNYQEISIIQLLTGVAGIITLLLLSYGSYLRYQNDKKQDTQINLTQNQIKIQDNTRKDQQFLDAIKLIEENPKEPKLGGLNILENLAKTSPEYRKRILEYLGIHTIKLKEKNNINLFNFIGNKENIFIKLNREINIFISKLTYFEHSLFMLRTNLSLYDKNLYGDIISYNPLIEIIKLFFKEEEEIIFLYIKIVNSHNYSIFDSGNRIKEKSKDNFKKIKTSFEEFKEQQLIRNNKTLNKNED
jgi:hypothetical protein